MKCELKLSDYLDITYNNISKDIANKLDNEVIKFLESNGYKPKMTKEYFKRLESRLKQKGLRLVVTPIYYANESNTNGIVYRMPEYKIEFEKIPSKYKKRVKVYDEYNLFRKHTFEFNPGVTVLIGRNGSGKSTLINEIYNSLKEDGEFVYRYRNEDYEGKTKSDYIYSGKFDMLARSMSNSEGQEIMFNLENHIGRVGNFVKKSELKGAKEVFVLFDGLDSGLSIDGIDELIELFYRTMIKDSMNNGIDMYIIVSANTYEFVRYQDCIFVSNASHVKFDNYEKYRRFILDKGRKTK